MFENVKLGIAPIAWTNDDMPDLGSENTFEQCISEMALAGFTGCEVGNKYPRDEELLKRKLDIRGMSIAGAWFSAFLTTKPYEETKEGAVAKVDENLLQQQFLFFYTKLKNGLRRIRPLWYNRFMNNKIKYQKDYTKFGEYYQLVLPLNFEKVIPEDDSVRLLSHELEELDYTLLYQTYSAKGRNPAVDPRISRYLSMQRHVPINILMFGKEQ